MKELLWILGALGLTLAVELPLSAVWWRKLSAVGGVLLVNMLTNPIINLEMAAVAVTCGGQTTLYWMILAVSEAAVVIVEGLLLQKMLGVSLKRAMVFSFAANFISYFAGLLLAIAGIL